MAKFKAVLLEHGYATARWEHEIIEAAGGELMKLLRPPAANSLMREIFH